MSQTHAAPAHTAPAQINETRIPDAAPPASTVGLAGWLRGNLFSTWYNSALTILILLLLLQVIPPIIDWLFISAQFVPTDAEGCRLAGVGACYPFLYEKHRLVLFGLYPFDQQWRPLIAVILCIALLLASCNREYWKPWLGGAWLVGIVAMWVLMQGGLLGLEYVENTKWGGLALTLGLSVVGLVVAFPLGIVLALGRRSQMPIIKTLSTAYIELIRGVPLITVLFMASVLLPLFLPRDVTIDKLLRAQVGLILFASAYLAEVVRGGLQAIPTGQYEAADSLGLSYWQKTRLIILPQALKISIPPIVNTFIGFFKDTSLVVIIGLYDLLGAAKAALTDAAWRGFYQEAYLFIAILYFVFCFSMSQYSQALERRLDVGNRR